MSLDQLQRNIDDKLQALAEFMQFDPLNENSPFKTEGGDLLQEARDLFTRKRRQAALDRLVSIMEDMQKVEKERRQMIRDFEENQKKLDKQMDEKAKLLEQLGFEIDQRLKVKKGNAE